MSIILLINLRLSERRSTPSVPNGFGRTKIYTNFFEKKMKVTGTARNWKTITTLLELAEKDLGRNFVLNENALSFSFPF